MDIGELDAKAIKMLGKGDNPFTQQMNELIDKPDITLPELIMAVSVTVSALAEASKTEENPLSAVFSRAAGKGVESLLECLVRIKADQKI